MASGMFGDAKRAKKDILADIVAIKHDYQNSIMGASMRKAILAESERAVKEDMGEIYRKLQALLKVIHDNARFYASQEVKTETEKLNDEILFLEDHYKRLDEMEEYIKENTSNTNLKPLQLGKEKCEYTRERLEDYKNGIKEVEAKFVLHPILSQILEQIENFTMGNTLLVPRENDSTIQEEELDEFDGDVTIPGNIKREPSRDPIRTTFMRSNSSKMIDLSDKKQKSISRQSSVSNISQQTGVDKPKSRLSVNEGKANKASAETQKVSKLIGRAKTNVKDTKEDTESRASNFDLGADRFRAVAGLRATLTERSASAPLMNLLSKQHSVFVEKKVTKPSPLQIKHKEVLKTKKHATSCYLTGISTLPNGTVVLCDGVHDSLQLYNAEMQQISEMECSHPWGVAAVSDSAVAVSLHYDHRLILVQADKALERINEKDIVLKCNASLIFDVKYNSYRLYTLCIDGDVHILDLKGREYGVIKSGFPTNTLKYLDIDTDKQLVIVSSERGVACLNFQGLPLWHFKPQTKHKLVCTGLMVCNGCILVCDWENNQLVEICDEGQSVRTVFSERLEKPVAMCRLTSGEEIFVTQGDYDLDAEKARTVHVLQLQIEENK